MPVPISQEYERKQGKSMSTPNNFNHFTGKKKIKVKHQHRNKYQKGGV
nr:MAG TPA: hypothetical protein [Caudoviricetes sp.]